MRFLLTLLATCLGLVDAFFIYAAIPAFASQSENTLRIPFVYQKEDSPEIISFQLKMVDSADVFPGLNGSVQGNTPGHQTFVSFAIPGTASGEATLQAITEDRKVVNAFTPRVQIRSDSESSSDRSTNTDTNTSGSLRSTGSTTITSANSEKTQDDVTGSQQGTPTGPVNEGTSKPTPSKSTNKSAGAMAGAVVSGVALLLVIVISIWYCRRRRNRSRRLRLSRSFISPYGETIPNITSKRERKGRGRRSDTDTTEDSIHRNADDIVPERRAGSVAGNLVEEASPDRSRQTGREPRFVVHDDSGWRPTVTLRPPHEEATSTVVIDLPPRYDAAV